MARAGGGFSGPPSQQPTQRHRCFPVVPIANLAAVVHITEVGSGAAEARPTAAATQRALGGGNGPSVVATLGFGLGGGRGGYTGRHGACARPPRRQAVPRVAVIGSGATVPITTVWRWKGGGEKGVGGGARGGLGVSDAKEMVGCTSQHVASGVSTRRSQSVRENTIQVHECAYTPLCIPCLW